MLLSFKSNDVPCLVPALYTNAEDFLLTVDRHRSRLANTRVLWLLKSGYTTEYRASFEGLSLSSGSSIGSPVDSKVFTKGKQRELHLRTYIYTSSEKLKLNCALVYANANGIKNSNLTRQVRVSKVRLFKSKKVDIPRLSLSQ